jgi:hypothetical protein
MPGTPLPTQNHQGRPPRRKWQAALRPHWIEIVLAVGLLVVGAGQIYVYIRQASIMETQTHISLRQTEDSEASQRAFISLRSIEVQSDQGKVTLPDGRTLNLWLVQPFRENTGNTPSRNLKIYMSPLIRTPIKPLRIQGPVTKVTERDSDLSFVAPKDADAWNQAVLAPHHFEGLQAIHADSQSLQDVVDNKIIYRIWGVARYSDIFPFTPEHITRFCYKITGVRGNPMDSGSKIELTYRQCLTGNCTDKECYDG